ncbi:endonuclease-reverse transcriptase [Plakobranchus ocellatus]|uniref:Endonuclease-reverse transcriptase n=1 Tax=Plakobranchus ocellatus TaxID=259542 RepID=A0AAV4DLP1_9GAST|nr:endonuclease-reverse transcriptase [Plakobranchus ocellatus]
MRIENKTSTFQDIKRGVRQCCVLSPDLFSLYSEIIMRNSENHPGIKVGGQNINNLRYADDTVLIAENKEDLQKLLNIVEEESRKTGLELNSKKTEVMVISRKQESPKCDIFINEVKLKQTEKFKYLGTIISNDGKTNREISARTAQAKINFQKMKTILTNKHISIETRKRALQCYIKPVLMYGCEAWTISKQIQNKLEATEMWFLSRMLRIPWTAKKTNERVLNEANKRRSLVRTIRKRRATFLGHVMRRGKLEHLVTTGKFEGKKSRGRQREKIMDDWPHGLDQEKCQIYCARRVEGGKERHVLREQMAKESRRKLAADQPVICQLPQLLNGPCHPPSIHLDLSHMKMTKTGWKGRLSNITITNLMTAQLHGTTNENFD